VIIFLPILLFSLSFLPFFYLIPGGDGDVEFKLAYLLLHGNYSPSLLTFHPPFTLFLFDIFFTLFGYWSTGFLGFLLGILGIIALYHIGKELFDKRIALISSSLLALSGLYISTGVFCLNDFIMTVLLLIAFAFYLKSKYFSYAVVISFAILTKETAIFFAISVLLVDLFQKKKGIVVRVIPLVVFFSWLGVLYLTGQNLWNAYNFSSTSSHGSTYTMLYNLVTLSFLNSYAYENWLHLFVFNYNWVYTIFALGSLFYIKENKKRKELLIIGIFSILFSVLVLGFQTWTINRYTLPMLPFLYLFAIYGAIKMRFTPVWIVIIFIASFLSLTESSDPLSQAIWPQIPVLNQNFFMNSMDGGDAITYNEQYLKIMRQRTYMLSHNQCNLPFLLSYDKETLTILGIKYCLK
jgi:4-amino-4-deoxy-L-arabinose transferase-like glycosyltransferase